MFKLALGSKVEQVKVGLQCFFQLKCKLLLLTESECPSSQARVFHTYIISLPRITPTSSMQTYVEVHCKSIGQYP